MPLNIVFWRPQKLVSTKALLLKHYYRRQGIPFILQKCQGFLRHTNPHFVAFLGHILNNMGDGGCRNCQGRIFLGHQRPTHRDIPDPDPRESQTKTLRKAPFSAAVDREWPGCPAIWVGTSQDHDMQENFGQKGA